MNELRAPDLAAGDPATWQVSEDAFDPDAQLHSETVFTIGNGQLCVRGSFEEGYPGDHPAAFMHRVWDDMPVSVTELANLPRWWGIDLWFDGERFRLDTGRLLAFTRRLDLRNGVLSRTVRWEAPTGAVVELAFERFVDFSSPHRAAVRVAISSDRPVHVRTRAGLDAHVENTGLLHWRLVDQGADDAAAWLHTRTRTTRIDLGSACRVTLDGVEAHAAAGGTDGVPTVEHAFELHPDRTARLTKHVAIVSGVDAADPVAVASGLAREAAEAGWDALREASDTAWANAWERSDVVIEGDPEAQLALRFSLFQLLIAAPRFTEHASIGAKTLSGFGYRHHVFWDTETFMVPPFSYSQPEIARNMLMYRWHGLAGARDKARGNGHRGAQFPWESAGTGEEVTPTWVPDPDDRTKLIRIWTGDIEIHITADIALAVMQYWLVTGDDTFICDHGAELILDGAVFWASAATLEDDGSYHFRNVVGPDEYHDRVDDNAYTNQLAAWHLRTATTMAGWLAEHHPERWKELSAALAVDAAELERWSVVASAMYLPVGADGLLEQFSGYFALTDLDVSELRDPSRTVSMQQRYGIDGIAETQVLKQPDVLMLAYLLPELFPGEALARNYAYYDPRTDHEHGSSLGPAISAVMACRAGEPEVGYQHFLRAARADLLDVRHNAGDGIHGASAGGLWQAVVFGFAGLVVTPDGWHTTPMLPKHWTRVEFGFDHHGVRQRVVVEA
jgi:kojibiose phosphorylase